jgi:nucleoside-diphosphate-sugar epimerase
MVCRLHIGDADEFVWSPGTIIIGEQPRHADPSPALPRGEAEQRPDRDGTGKPPREFLFVDDLADTCLFVLEHYSDEQHKSISTATAIPSIARKGLRRI